MTCPSPPAAATCNLFCLRARVAGAGSRGVGRGVGAAAPQVVLAQRGRIRGAEPHAPGPRCPPPVRPLAAPSSRASPPRVPPPLPALRLRLRRPRSTPRLLGGAGGELGPWGRGGAAAQPPTPRGGTAAVAAGGRGFGWSRLRPMGWAGLKEARCCRCHHHRSGPGPSVQPALPPPPVPGCPRLGAPPACVPAGEWEGDGAPPPALSDSAASPSTPVAGRPGAMCNRGLAQDRPSLFSSLATGGAVGPVEGAGRGASPSRSRAGSPPLLGSPFSRSDVAVRGTWSGFLFPGCGRAARPEN